MSGQFGANGFRGAQEFFHALGRTTGPQRWRLRARGLVSFERIYCWSGITTGVPGLAGPDVVQLVLLGRLGSGTRTVFSALLQRGQGGDHH